MAREVVLRDDLDGARDQVETITLTFEGHTVELDLSASNRAALAETLERYFAAGRVVRRPATSNARRSRTTRRDAAERTAIRTWARESGIELPPRGPIPGEVVTRYRQDHGGEA